MPLVVEPVPDALLFDADVKLTRASLQTLFDMGFRGGLRTVPLPGNSAAQDIDRGEIEDFMAVGLGLMLYQHVRFSPWAPSAARGVHDGGFAADWVKGAGYLPGGSLFNDLEGIAGSGSAADTIAYANAKFEVAAASGYPQGEYIGYGVPLSSAQLFHELRASCYWRSFSSVPDVDVRSYAMRQLVGAIAAGHDVDITIASADRLGGRAHWMRNVA